jgi:uncharacterized protein YhbP (UPF0306 family)
MMDERIVDFIKAQTVATVCCVDEENRPYCFSCFYAFDRERNLFYFKSSENAHHSALLLRNNRVAGTIQPDKLNSLAIKGIQFTGTIIDPKNELSFNASKMYHRKYPFALAMPGDVWTLQPDVIKMTDNTLSFGKKLHWQLHQMA